MVDVGAGPSSPVMPGAGLKACLPYLWTILTLGLCIAKPMNVDDYLFVFAAKNIARDFLDPYAGNILWYFTWEPFFELNENPPLLSYWLALTSAWSDWNPVVMHIALLPFTLAGVMGIGILSRQFGGNGWVAQMGLATSSLWLVSASSLMLEVPMVALSTWGLVAVRRSELRPDTAVRWAALSGLVLGFAFLTKYSAIVPVGAIGLSLLARRCLRPTVAFVAGFVVVAGAFEVFTFVQYGVPKFLDAVLFATTSNQRVASTGLRVLSTLMFLGAGGLSLIAMSTANATRRGFALVSGLTALLTWMLVFVVLPGGSSQLPLSLSVVLHAGAFIGAGTWVLWILWKAPPQSGRVLLMSGVVATLLFSSILNWSTNARSVIPALPFLAVWLSMSAPAQHTRNAVMLGISALISGLVLWGDVAWASSLRASAIWADQFLPVDRERIFFVGHWGFQPAMESFGFEPLDEVKPARAGDLVVVPGGTYAGPAFHEDDYVDGYDEHTAAPASTMDGVSGAGFYMVTEDCPFPFTLGNTLRERIYIFRLTPGPLTPTAKPSQASLFAK